MEFKARLCLFLLLSFTFLSSARIVTHPGTQIITNSNNLDSSSLWAFNRIRFFKSFVLYKLKTSHVIIEVSEEQTTTVVINDYAEPGANNRHDPRLPPPKFNVFTVADDESNKKPYTNLFIGRQLVGRSINKET